MLVSRITAGSNLHRLNAPARNLLDHLVERELRKNRVEYTDRNLSRVACGGITFLFRGHVAHQGGADFRCSYCRRYQARGREELPASRRFRACIATHSVLEYLVWQSRGNSRLRTSSAPALYDLTHFEIVATYTANGFSGSCE